MPRPYVKRSSYWSQPRTQVPVAPQPPIVVNTAPAVASVKPVPFPDIAYGTTEIATASGVPASGTNSRGPQVNQPGTDPAAFQNIKSFPLSYAGFGDNRQYTGIRDCVELCMRAYSGFATYRNAVEVSVEFSNQQLYIKTDNETPRVFFQEWFKAIQMNKMKEEFFREYYRSGNVFFYKFSGKFGPGYYKNFQQSFGASNNRIPIRYSLINPANVFVPTGLTFPYTYVRLLSIYDIERLRNPLTEQDKQVYRDLPKFVRDQIDVTSAFPLGIYIPLEPERLRFAFYKKQSYEPLATPMGYPVMADIEWKLTLQKIDMQVARILEQAILLVTTGETGTQYNGGNGINPNNIARLQNLFTNQTVGRVVVADFTTEAEWLIPDVGEILGPEKYQIVNENIQEGLQSIFVGNDSKFATAQIKAKIFIQRLEEGQNVFLNDFLIPEIVQVCQDMGFRTVPEVGFRKIDLQDATVMNRVYAQLGQLGILTGPQVVHAIETSELPDNDEMDEAQTAYKKARDKGQYLPLVGASLQDDADEQAGGQVGRPGGSTGIPQTTKRVSPMGAKGAISARAYVENLKASQKLVESIGSHLCKTHHVKELNEPQQRVAESLAKLVMAGQPPARWLDSVASIVEKPLAISAAVRAELAQLRSDYQVDELDAILLRHSKTVPPKE